MHQTGVEVRPIIQITGGSSFNEVFLTDARVPAENLIGEEGYGWRVLATALSVERVMLGGMNAGANTQPRSAPGGLVPTAIERGRNKEPEIRQAIARLYGWQMAIRWNGMRAKTGNSPSVASINKIAQSRIAKKGAELEVELLGIESLLDEPNAPSGEAMYRYLGSFSSSLVGGTDQIQRNIIGERVLGLPREPEVDRDIPFRDVKKAASRS
jgi:alkylation response protein AidB-like acyl-CoA dehydrogenase